MHRKTRGNQEATMQVSLTICSGLFSLWPVLLVFSFLPLLRTPSGSSKTAVSRFRHKATESQSLKLFSRSFLHSSSQLLAYSHSAEFLNLRTLKIRKWLSTSLVSSGGGNMTIQHRLTKALRSRSSLQVNSSFQSEQKSCCAKQAATLFTRTGYQH